MTRVRAIYVSATGQDDNLGDSVLRRGYLNSLRRPGVELNVLVGQNSTSYIGGLELRDTDNVYTSPSLFRRSCALSAITRKTIFAFNTGEMRLDNDYLKTFLGHLPLVLLTRARGGGAVHLGFGIRNTSPKWRRTIRFVLSLCRAVSWRDEQSQQLMRLGHVQPDWAFAELSRSRNPESPRTKIVVSLRGDRPAPPIEWIARVRALAAATGFTVAVHSQVRRDNERAEELANQLGATVAIWPEEADHAQWELTTTQTYGEAAIVISDRLHALIIAAREGAVPFGLAPASAEKLSRTMKPAGLDRFVCSATSSEAEGTQADVIEAALDPAHRGSFYRVTYEKLVDPISSPLTDVLR